MLNNIMVNRKKKLIIIAFLVIKKYMYTYQNVFVNILVSAQILYSYHCYSIVLYKLNIQINVHKIVKSFNINSKRNDTS